MLGGDPGLAGAAVAAEPVGVIVALLPIGIDAAVQPGADHTAAGCKRQSVGGGDDFAQLARQDPAATPAIEDGVESVDDAEGARCGEHDGVGGDVDGAVAGVEAEGTGCIRIGGTTPGAEGNQAGGGSRQVMAGDGTEAAAEVRQRLFPRVSPVCRRTPRRRHRGRSRHGRRRRRSGRQGRPARRATRGAGWRRSAAGDGTAGAGVS